MIFRKFFKQTTLRSRDRYFISLKIMLIYINRYELFSTLEKKLNTKKKILIVFIFF